MAQYEKWVMMRMMIIMSILNNVFLVTGKQMNKIKNLLFKVIITNRQKKANNVTNNTLNLSWLFYCAIVMLSMV